MHHNLTSLRPAGPAWNVDPHEAPRGSGTMTDPQNYLHSGAQFLAGPMDPEFQLHKLHSDIPQDAETGKRIHTDDATPRAVTFLRGRLTFYTWGQCELCSVPGESTRQGWARGEPAPKRLGPVATETRHPLWSRRPNGPFWCLFPMTALYSETASHAL